MSIPPLTDALHETLAVFERQPSGRPLTTREVATELDSGRRSTYDKLDRLVDGDHLATKAVGARGRVWWRPTDAAADGSHDVSFRSLVAAVEEYAIFRLSPAGRVTTWNRGAERIKGYERDEIVGEPLETFYTDADVADGIPERNLAAAAANGSIEAEGWRVTKDGSRFWAAVTITAIYDDAGELAGYAKVTKDTTEQRAYRKRLRRQRDRLETEIDEVFERVDDAFVALDEGWRFAYVNDRAADLIGSPPGELLGTVVWEALPEVADGRPRRLVEEAVNCQESVEFTFSSERLDGWIQVRAFPSSSGLSVYFRDVTDRKERERELERYRTIVETVGEGIYVVDDDGRFTMVNSAYAELTGRSRRELLGAHVSLVVDEETVERAREYEDQLLAGECETARFRAAVRTADGGRVPAEASFTMLASGDDPPERIGVVRDVTAQVRRERELERQRERLAAIDDLNAVVREVMDSVIEQSTREEIEQTVCDLLTASDSYDFAWIGDIDLSSRTLRHRVNSGAADSFDDLTVTTDPADPRSEGPIGRAIQTETLQVTRDVQSVAALDGWRDLADEHDISSVAAIPIVHEGILYGVLSVYTARDEAFTVEEREVIDGIGEVVGHAIASVNRKRALMSDEVVEVELRIPDFTESLDLDASGDGRVELDQTVPMGDGEFLVYGSATADGVDVVHALVSAFAHWRDVAILDDSGETTRFQARLSEPSVLSRVAALGGRVVRAVIEGGDLDVLAWATPGGEVREVIETVRESYPAGEMVSRRQVSRDDHATVPSERNVMDVFTDRQRAVLVAAYESGFFEQPRANSGEEIAASLGLSATTFHQHLRVALRKTTDAVLTDAR